MALGAAENMQEEEVTNPMRGSDSLWVNAQKAYEDRFLRLAAHAKNWRLFAFFCLAIAFLAIGGVIYIGSQSKFIPMVVEVDKLGRTVAVRALNGDDAVKDTNRLVYREIFDLVENLRTVTTDRTANNDRLNKGFSRLKGAADTYVHAELKKAPPNEVGTLKTVIVKVRSALREGKGWLVEWDEQSVSLTGETMGEPEHWKARLQYELNPSPDPEIFKRNPIGFQVTELNWTKVM